MTTEAPAGMRIGHVHLKVSDLDRSIDFYQRVLGLKLMQRYGPSAAFLSAGGYHHHLGLNTWDSKGAGPAPRGYPGLFHTAFLFPDRKTLGEAMARAIEAGVEISGAADHGVSEAVYFDDPDGNGVEIYRDRPEADWPRDENGDLALYNRPLDLEALLVDAGVTLPA